MPINHAAIVVSRRDDIDTLPAPINPAWILSGEPEARAVTLSQSPDKDAVTVLWECTAGVFRWRFDSDETVHVVEGGVTIHWNGERHTLGAGDTCYFPAGSVATWIVHSRIRKIAFIRVPPPRPVNLALRAWRALLRQFRSAARPAGAGALNPQAQTG